MSAVKASVPLLDKVELPSGSLWGWLLWLGGLAGVVGIAASFLLGGVHDPQFLFSWLTAFMYWLSIALGGLFFVCALYVTRAGWGVVVRRVAEHAMSTLPVFALLFIPIWLGREHLFHWLEPGVIEGDALLQTKTWWLNDGAFGFSVRAVVYFVLWTGLAVYFGGRSRQQDQTGDHAITRRLQALSAPTLIVFALTCSAAAIDWLMTLDPHWYSTMFGVYYFAGTLIGIFAFMVVVLITLQWSGLLTNVVTGEHFHDMGKLLFAFTVFWAYIAFSQYFLIWYGNLPEETVWFLHRLQGSWKSMSLLLAVGHFVVPFFFFMPRTIKRIKGLMLLGALWMLLMHYVDIYWIAMPVLHPHGFHIGLLDLATFVGVGGVFVAAFSWNLRRAALIPVRDPRLPESLAFENI